MAAAAYHACRGAMVPRATGLDLVRVTSRSTSTSVASLTAHPLPRMRVAPTTKAATTRPSGTWPACVAIDAPYRHGQSSSKAPDGRWSRASSTYAHARPSIPAFFSSLSPSARFGRASEHKQRLPRVHARAHAFICARSIATSFTYVPTRRGTSGSAWSASVVEHASNTCTCTHVSSSSTTRKGSRVLRKRTCTFPGAREAKDDDVEHVRARTFNLASTFPWPWVRRLPLALASHRSEVSRPLPLASARLLGSREAREALPIRNRARATRGFRSTSDPPLPPSSNAGGCRSSNLAQVLLAAPNVARVLRRSQDRFRLVRGALRRATHAWPCLGRTAKLLRLAVCCFPAERSRASLSHRKAIDALAFDPHAPSDGFEERSEERSEGRPCGS
mmetsp:Transcript_11151/g.68673  ORF Transcript_11151/g.68673 Transcript_11151/m.68673 type:complete len:390 (-) Transcript_11151:67-1236(-)